MQGTRHVCHDTATRGFLIRPSTPIAVRSIGAVKNKIMVPKVGQWTIEDDILSGYHNCIDMDCDSENLRVECVVTRSWRGWHVVCNDCGTLVAEIDPPETPIDHRRIW